METKDKELGSGTDFCVERVAPWKSVWSRGSTENHSHTNSKWVVPGLSSGMWPDRRKQLTWHARGEQWVPVTTSLTSSSCHSRGGRGLGSRWDCCSRFSFLITWSVEKGYWKQRPSCAHCQFKHNEDKGLQTQKGSGFNLRCLHSSFIIWKGASSNNGRDIIKWTGPPSCGDSCHQTLNHSQLRKESPQDKERKME